MPCASKIQAIPTASTRSLTIPPDILTLRQGERVRLRYAGEHSLSLGRD